MASKESKITNILRRASTHIGLIAAIITGIITVGGAAIGVGNWVVDNVNSKADARIAALQKELDESNKRQELGMLRLELLSLMSHDSDNVVEIEKVGRRYFQDYNGNWYLTGLFSKWCNEHNCDASIVLEGGK